MAIDIFGFAVKPELSIGDLAAIVALLVSSFTFYLSYTRSKKSEQIRISREIWDRIDAQEDIIEKWTVGRCPGA
jgi:hypothetical protein